MEVGGVLTGSKRVAIRTVSSLGAIIEHAVSLGLIEPSPAGGVCPFAGQPHEDRLSTGRSPRWRAMRELAAESKHAAGDATIRHLLLTGFVRLGV